MLASLEAQASLMFYVSWYARNFRRSKIPGSLWRALLRPIYEFGNIHCGSTTAVHRHLGTDLDMMVACTWTGCATCVQPLTLPGTFFTTLVLDDVTEVIRRLECYQCCAPRGKDVQRISNEPMGPSNILKVSCLDPQTRSFISLTLLNE